MTAASTSPPSAKKAILSQHALLESLVAIASKHFNEQIIGVGQRLVGALLDVDDLSDPRRVYLRIKAGNLLKENSYAFVHLATTEFEQTLRRELEQLVPTLKKVRAEVTELSLVPYEEMDTKVEFDGYARPFEFKYAAPLANLNVRMGMMLDREILRTSQNPFRPDVILTVLHRAWVEFEPDEQAHCVVPPLLRPDVVFDLAPLYEALSDALVRKGAQPGSVDALNIKKTENAAAAKQARAKQKADLARQLRKFLEEGGDAGGLEADIPLIPDLPQAAGGSGGWRPSAASGFHAAAAQGAPASPFVSSGAAAQPGRAGGPFASSGSDLQPGQPGGRFASGGAAFVPGPVGLQHGEGHGHGQGHGVGQGGVHAGHGHGGIGHGGQGHGGQGQGGQGQGGGHGIGGGHGFGGEGAAQLHELLKNLQARMPEQMARHHGAMAGHAGAGEPGHGQGQGQGQVHAHPMGDPRANIFYLPRLKESMKGSLSRGDESTIDLLSKIFDTVFIDPNIPAEIRELIQFLQIPVLRAALADKNFFFEEAHPARRMIDLMSKIGMEQRKAPDDPLYQAMRRSVDKVGSQVEEQETAFTEALADLEQSVKQDEAVAESAIAAPIAAALKQEKVVAATRSARSAVAARIGSGQVVAMLETFLEDKWTSVLTLAYSVEEEKPGAIKNATKTMDDLIWSVKPKITHEERRALITRLPGLLAALNRWLDVIKWQDDARARFFAELAECHASIVRAPLDITPERQLEIAVEVAQQDAIRRIEKEQQAEKQAEVTPTDIDDTALAIEALERGQWLEFTQPDASVRKVKLAWISPLRTLFIFSTGARQEAFSVPVEKLQAAFREDKVKVLRMDGVVSRALSDAMREAGNDPAVPSAQAA